MTAGNNAAARQLRRTESALRRTGFWLCRTASPKRPSLGANGMQFLKTLFWVLIAVIVVLFASRNWTNVTINLWGNLLADINLPLLLLIAFLLGLLPTWLIMRARLWASKRRVEALERTQAAVVTQPTVEPAGEPIE
jgi:uncharacterized integral membrane protein